MAIFNQKKPSSSPAATPRPRPMERQTGDTKPRTATYIAAGSKVTGEITGSSEVLVDGLFEGRLNLDSNVVVGREGRVTGEITARAVRVEGKVVGDVRGHERVEVMASGTLEGDIAATRVVIAEGAFFKGKVEMTSQQGSTGQQESPRPSQGNPVYGKKKHHGPPQQQHLKGQGGPNPPSLGQQGSGQATQGPPQGGGGSATEQESAKERPA